MYKISNHTWDLFNELQKEFDVDVKVSNPKTWEILRMIELKFDEVIYKDRHNQNRENGPG